jgi:Clp protease
MTTATPPKQHTTKPNQQVTPTLALYDTMQYVRSPTATVCYGMCLGMGGFLLTAGGEKVRGQEGMKGVFEGVLVVEWHKEEWLGAFPVLLCVSSWLWLSCNTYLKHCMNDNPTLLCHHTPPSPLPQPQRQSYNHRVTATPCPTAS